MSHDPFLTNFDGSPATFDLLLAEIKRLHLLRHAAHERIGIAIERQREMVDVLKQLKAGVLLLSDITVTDEGVRRIPKRPDEDIHAVS
jgi:hypothetical protein